MNAHEYGPPQVFEVIWMSGHAETVLAHQVTHSSLRQKIGAIGEGRVASETAGARIKFHAEIDGHWTLQLSALEEDIRTIRNVTSGEQTPGGAR